MSFDLDPYNDSAGITALSSWMQDAFAKYTDFIRDDIFTAITRVYGDRSLFLSTGYVPAAGTIVVVAGLQYKYVPGSTAIFDAPGWEPAGGWASPGHFGGKADGVSDDTAAVQACFDFVRSRYNNANGTFDYDVFFEFKTWRVTNVHLTALAQPRLGIGCGTLYFTSGAEAFGLELFGTNALRITGPFMLEADVYDETKAPDFILAYGRCERDGVEAPIAPSFKGGLIIVQGMAKKASVLNFGSEVSDINYYITNRNPSDSSYGYAAIGDMDDAVDIWGSALVSANCTLPTASSDTVSNILHDLGSSEVKRSSLYAFTITNITQGNPAVATFTVGSTFTSSLMANTDTVWVNSVVGMTEVNQQRHTIANLTLDPDGLGGTFELSGVNSTGYGAYVSGGAGERTTGSAVVIAQAKSVVFGPSAYLLTYGSPAVQVFMKNNTISNFIFRGQTEKQVPHMVEFILGTDSQVIQDLTFHDLSASQEYTSPFKVTTGGGNLRIDNLDLQISTLGVAVPLCTNGGNLNVRNGRVIAPQALDISTLIQFTGYIVNTSTNQLMFHGITIESLGGDSDLSGGVVNLGEINFATSGTALTGPGMRYSGDSLFTYRSSVGAERRIMVQDSAITGDLTDITDRVNTQDKYPGKLVWSASTNTLAIAMGGAASSEWKEIDLSTATTRTPV